jgi:hypothetical protein
LVIIATVPVLEAPVEEALRTVPVLAALLPVRVKCPKVPVKAVAADPTVNPVPEVKESQFQVVVYAPMVKV